MAGRFGWMWAVALVTWAAGCGPGPVAVDSAKVDPAGWRSVDTVQLTFNVDHPEHRHDVQLGLLHSEDYPFSNLYLFLRLDYPNGRTLRDTLECTLAASSGKWLGDGSHWIDRQVSYQRGVGFPLPGEYTLNVVHAMRQDPLPEVAELRVALFDRQEE